MECSDLSRTGVSGLEGHYIINIDHHAGNRMYGALNWFDESAAACGEMVFDVIRALGVALTPEIATHIYLAILTDTGSFHHSNITPRTFDICRQTVEAGREPGSDGAPRVRQQQLRQAEADWRAARRDGAHRSTGKLAVLYLDDAMLAACGCTHNDTEGVINLPLTAREIQAVVFFKVGVGRLRCASACDRSTTSTCALVANEFGGGGHKNAARLHRHRTARSGAGRSSSNELVAAIGEGLADATGAMNGVLVVDKPAGPTSHDVVGRARRALGVSRIGHTGTLDPLATGVLPLVVGRATRLAQFLTAERERVRGGGPVRHWRRATYDADGVQAAARSAA